MTPPEDSLFYGQPDCRETYRYWLHRDIDAGEGSVLFIMLNPSDALSLGDQDDRTVACCIKYARRWNCRNLTVVNLFAFRATDPDELLRCPNEIIGEHNNAAIDWAVDTVHSDGGRIVCAWGNSGILRCRNCYVLNRLSTLHIQGYCLALTDKGHPRHPLRFRGNIELNDLAPMPAGQ